MTATLIGTRTRYTSSLQHDISRCKRGLSAILGATCPCAGSSTAQSGAMARPFSSLGRPSTLIASGSSLAARLG